MKKIFSLIITFILLIATSSCADVGNPTITYIDDDGTVKSQIIHSSNDEKYVENVVDLINKIKPDNYSYYIYSIVNSNIKGDFNGEEISYYFFSGDELIHNSNESVHLNKINTQNTFSINDNKDTALSKEFNITECIYPNATYVSEGQNKYIKYDNKIKDNIFYELCFDKIFNKLDKSFVKDYKLVIFDVTKSSIIFSLNYDLLVKKEYKYQTSLNFTVDASNGLITSIELVNPNFSLEKMNSFTDNKYEYSNITYINSITKVNIVYDDIPNILLTEEEIDKFQ